MRSQPLFICPAMWPRYCCGEKNSRSFKRSRRLWAHGESFLPPTQGTSFNKPSLTYSVWNGRWGEERVIALTTKNHMHIHFCASNYKGAAGHGLALIIVTFVLSVSTLVTTVSVFLNDNLQKAKNGLCRGFWLSHKAFVVFLPNSTAETKCWIFIFQNCVVSVLANNLSVAQFW